MATLMNRNGVWYARFRHNGKAYLRSTNVPVSGKGAKLAESRSLAETAFNRIMAEVTGGESVDTLTERLMEAIDKLPEQDQQIRRITIADRLRQGIAERMLLSDAWEAWINHPNRGVAGDSTVCMYKCRWGRLTPIPKKSGKVHSCGFLYWLATYHPHVKYMHEINFQMAEGYASFLKSQNMAPRTYNGAIKFLRSMFKTLMLRAGLAHNVWDSINRIPNNTAGRRNFTSEELQKVCSAATGDMRYLIAIGLYTGLRLGDVVTLKWSAGYHVNGNTMPLGIFLDEQMIRLIPGKTRRKMKAITIPIHPVLHSLLSTLRQQMSGDGFLFPDLARIYLHGDASRITSELQSLFRSCGIETTERIPGRSKVVVRVGFHSLRHSFVSLCAANKIPQLAIQDLVGHGSPAMTALYAHADEKQKSQAINLLPDMVFSDVA
jgi:integrase